MLDLTQNNTLNNGAGNNQNNTPDNNVNNNQSNNNNTPEFNLDNLFMKPDEQTGELRFYPIPQQQDNNQNNQDQNTNNNQQQNNQPNVNQQQQQQPNFASDPNYNALVQQVNALTAQNQQLMGYLQGMNQQQRQSDPNNPQPKFIDTLAGDDGQQVFANAVQQAVFQVLAPIAPVLQQQQQHMVMQRDFYNTAAKYNDFHSVMEANKDVAIDLVKKGANFETAYNLIKSSKQNVSSQQINQQQQQELQQRANQLSTEKGHSPNNIVPMRNKKMTPADAVNMSMKQLFGG